MCVRVHKDLLVSAGMYVYSLLKAAIGTHVCAVVHMGILLKLEYNPGDGIVSPWIKIPPAMPESHMWVIEILAASILVRLPLMLPRRQQRMVQVFGSLPSMWETWMEPLGE